MVKSRAGYLTCHHDGAPALCGGMSERVPTLETPEEGERG